MSKANGRHSRPLNLKETIATLRALEAEVKPGEWVGICGSYLNTGLQVVRNETGEPIADVYEVEYGRLIETMYNSLVPLLNHIDELEAKLEKLEAFKERCKQATDAWDSMDSSDVVMEVINAHEALKVSTNGETT